MGSVTGRLANIIAAKERTYRFTVTPRTEEGL
jgi:hypothetical protein